MLSNDQLYILDLLRESFDLPHKNMKLENEQYIADAIRNCGIVLTVYPTIKVRDQKAEELEKDLRSYYFATLKQITNQEFEGKRILKALSEADLKCIALKGWELRSLYPKKHMRQMADLDILVKPYEYSEIKEIMMGLGFQPEGESSGMHDNFKKDKITVEVHKRLTDEKRLIPEWEKDMWKRVIPDSGSICKMSPEDYYIFHFVHLYKDFMHGMLGIRRIVDTWLLQGQSVDMPFVKENLKKFGMWQFHEKMVHLSRMMMGEEELDDDAMFLLEHAFTYGIYGTMKSYKINFVTTMGKNAKLAKLKAWLWVIFLPYRRMKLLFPILGKWPFLLPFCWIVRVVRVLKGDLSGKIKKVGLGDISYEEYDKMKQFYKSGGV